MQQPQTGLFLKCLSTNYVFLGYQTQVLTPKNVQTHACASCTSWLVELNLRVWVGSM